MFSKKLSQGHHIQSTKCTSSNIDCLHGLYIHVFCENHKIPNISTHLGFPSFSGLLEALQHVQGWICMLIQTKSILNHVNGCWTNGEFYSRISNVLAFPEKSWLLQIGQTPGIIFLDCCVCMQTEAAFIYQYC